MAQVRGYVGGAAVRSRRVMSVPGAWLREAGRPGRGALAEGALMLGPQNSGAGPPARQAGKDGPGKSGWPVAVSCFPMLAGAAALVLTRRASIIFLILFASCTAILFLLMAGVYHAHRR